MGCGCGQPVVTPAQQRQARAAATKPENTASLAPAQQPSGAPVFTPPAMAQARQVD